MNKNVLHVNVDKLVKVMEQKIKEGYEAIEKLPITDPGCARAVVNMLEFDTTIQQLKGEGRFKVVDIPVKKKFEKNEVEVDL